VRIAETSYTLSHAARQLHVGRHTIWRWIRSGELPAQKLGAVVFIEKALVDQLTPESRSTSTNLTQPPHSNLMAIQRCQNRLVGASGMDDSASP